MRIIKTMYSHLSSLAYRQFCVHFYIVIKMVWDDKAKQITNRLVKLEPWCMFFIINSKRNITSTTRLIN